MKMLYATGDSVEGASHLGASELIMVLGDFFQRYEYTVLFAVADEYQDDFEGKFDINGTFNPVKIGKDDLEEYLSSVRTHEGFVVVGHIIRPTNMPMDDSMETRHAWRANADIIFDGNPLCLIAADEVVDRAFDYYSKLEGVNCRVASANSLGELQS